MQPIVLAALACVGGWGFLRVIGHVVVRLATKHLTALDLLKVAGKPRGDGKLSGKAVVAGAGLAGLITARVLSDHFEEVVVVEPDEVNVEQKPVDAKRPRVMQWHGHHCFLAITRSVLGALFPSFDEEAKKADMQITSIESLNAVVYGRTLTMTPEKAPSMVVTWRPALELFLRRLIISQYPNVKAIQGTVTALTASQDGHSITEVTYRQNGTRTSSAEDEKTIPTSFFVDCTSLTSISSKLLSRANAAWRGPQRTDSYAGKARYSSAFIPISKVIAAKIDLGVGRWEDMAWVRYILPDSQRDTRGFTISKIDSGTLQITAYQWGDLHTLPSTNAEFLTWCTDIEENIIDEPPKRQLLQGLAWLFDTLESSGVHVTWNSIRLERMYFARYDLLPPDALPDNFAVIGDALIRLNPVFGQGSAKAMVDALSLDGCLRDVKAKKDIPRNFSTRLLKAQVRRVGSLFDLTRWMDYAYPDTEVMSGESHSTGAPVRAYMRAAMSVGHTNLAVGDRIHGILHLTKPPTELFHPEVLAGVFRRWLSLTFR